MTTAHYDLLLRQWGQWSITGGVIPKKMWESKSKWQMDVASEYPEEHDDNSDIDDDLMSDVDRAVCMLRDGYVKAYVVILDTYRNKRRYELCVVDDAVAAFGLKYESLAIPVRRRRYA